MSVLFESVNTHCLSGPFPIRIHSYALSGLFQIGYSMACAGLAADSASLCLQALLDNASMKGNVLAVVLKS